MEADVMNRFVTWGMAHVMKIVMGYLLSEIALADVMNRFITWGMAHVIKLFMGDLLSEIALSEKTLSENTPV